MDTERQNKGIGLVPLAALVIGSAIGGRTSQDRLEVPLFSVGYL